VRAKNPPPPAIGDVYDGPRLSPRPTRYHVRAIVDNEGEDAEYGWIYQVVFRFWSPRKGWRYEVVSSHALGAGLYKARRRSPSKRAQQTKGYFDLIAGPPDTKI
jgi:hypothetical protein